MRRAGNAWSTGVLRNFHLDLVSGKKGYTAIKNFVLAKNVVGPNSISHSKFLSCCHCSITPTLHLPLSQI